MSNTEKNQEIAASKAGMDPKTARKYLAANRLPSELGKERHWRTRGDPFDEVWDQVRLQIEENPGLEAKTLFEWLQREHPGRYSDGQIRTLQRRIKLWRATEGPAQEVYFGQKHEPGKLCASDFTHMTELGITIQGQTFAHLVFHFVLTYSNWEAGTICYSESLESLTEGWQNAVWELGAVPVGHRTDSLSSAVNNMSNLEEFNQRYEAVMKYYGVKPQHTNPASPNENGDVEQSHHRFKKAVDQALLLRGSRDFASEAEYAQFLKNLMAQRNAGRRQRLAEELAVMRELPARRMESAKRERVKVDSGQPDPCRPECLFGEQPADRREGGSAFVPGPRGDLVRPEEGGRFAAAAGTSEAPSGLPAHHRVAGAQAGCLRELPLQGRFVSHQPLSDGIRCAPGNSGWPGGEGVLEDSETGGGRGRNGCG